MPIHALDHVVIAVRDLAGATDQMSSLLGRSPSWRGEHPEQGTANTLYRLENTYVELMAPRGEGPIGRGLGGHLAEQGDGVFALAFAVDDAPAFAAELRARGVAAGEPRDGSGRDEHGAERRWCTVLLPPDASRGVTVFAIEHRSGELPECAPDADPGAAVAALDHVVLFSDDLEAARRFYGETLGIRLALDRVFEKRGQRILFFRSGGTTVEVVGPAEPPEQPDGRDRLWGLAWRVADAEGARDRLAGHGFDVSPLRPGAKPGTRVCTVRGDPCGVPTLVIGPGDGS